MAMLSRLVRLKFDGQAVQTHLAHLMQRAPGMLDSSFVEDK